MSHPSFSISPQSDTAHEKYRIALYIRVSTEEQAENPEGSLKNQEMRLRQAVLDRNRSMGAFGEIVGIYIDRARSGKEPNRPELQRLLLAIRSKEVNLVMVTELSRFSRSIRDFAEMWDLMRVQKCQFLSLNDNYDTSTPAGEMILYSMMNFAQFERKQTALRVSNHFAARAKRGLFNGGAMPLGYALDPERKGYLKVDGPNAESVKKAFQYFIEEKGLSLTAKRLNREGYRRSRISKGRGPRLGFFTVSNLHHILNNKTYLGIRVILERGKEIEVPAVWPAIISRAVFEKAQEILKKNHRRKKPATASRYPYLLTGLAVKIPSYSGKHFAVRDRCESKEGSWNPSFKRASFGF